MPSETKGEGEEEEEEKDEIEPVVKPASNKTESVVPDTKGEKSHESECNLNTWY